MGKASGDLAGWMSVGKWRQPGCQPRRSTSCTPHLQQLGKARFIISILNRRTLKVKGVHETCPRLPSLEGKRGLPDSARSGSCGDIGVVTRQ